MPSPFYGLVLGNSKAYANISSYALLFLLYVSDKNVQQRLRFLLHIASQKNLTSIQCYRVIKSIYHSLLRWFGLSPRLCLPRRGCVRQVNSSTGNNNARQQSISHPLARVYTQPTSSVPHTRMNLSRSTPFAYARSHVATRTRSFASPVAW